MQAQLPAKENSFPILGVKELVNVLNSGFSVGFPKVTENDFKTPTPTKVREVFEAFVNMVLLTSGEDKPPKFQALQTLESPELFEEYIKENTFIRNLDRVLKACAFNDFSPARDLRRPEQKRFVIAISAMINYLKFREERMDDYQQISGVLSAVEEERKLVEDEFHRLQNEVNQLRAQRNSEEPLVQELENECANLSAQIGALNTDQLALTNQSHELKQSAMQLGEVLAQLKFELLSLKQENQRLKAQVVPDPEKAKRQLRDLGGALDIERGVIEEQDRKATELRTRVEALGKLVKDLIRVQKLLEETEAERGKFKAARHSIKDTQNKIALSDQKAHDVSLNQQHVHKQVVSMQEKLQRLQRRQAAKREQANQALEEARQERQRLEADKDAHRAKLEQNDAAIKMLQQRVSDVEREHASEVQLLQSHFESLVATVHEYHNQLESRMQPTR